MAEVPAAMDLAIAFRAIRGALPAALPRPAKQFYALHDLQLAFRALKRPLAAAKDTGGLINPWALASLGYDEVRTAAALAGLWMTEFGGEASRHFLQRYLSCAIPSIDWGGALQAGYRVATEVCPMGDAADRVDLVVEAPRHLIGIEVKIRAGLGPDQLERYSKTIERRAGLLGLTPHVVLLAPFRAKLESVVSTSWDDVARAACAIASGARVDQTFTQNLIASFGDHIRSF